MVVGYATTALPFLDRTLGSIGSAARCEPDGSWRDADGLVIEQFGRFDNLMIEGAIAGSSGILVVEDRPPADRWRDLSVFERCVRLVAERLIGRDVVPSSDA
jgi:nucleoside 2-deoxyribosyltransferase